MDIIFGCDFCFVDIEIARGCTSVELLNSIVIDVMVSVRLCESDRVSLNGQAL